MRIKIFQINIKCYKEYGKDKTPCNEEANTLKKSIDNNSKIKFQIEKFS